MISINRKNPTAGEVTSSLTNAADGGLHFNGAGQATATATSLPVPYSFEVIFKADDVTTQQTLFGNSGSGTERRALAIKDGKLIFTYYEGGSWTNATGGNLEVGKVYHAVGTRDASGSQKVYINGENVTTGTTPDGYMQSTLRALGSANGGTYFKGDIFRARIFNYVVNPKELFENKTVSWVDQWGSQTNLINAAANGDFSGAGNWTSNGNHTASVVSGELQVVASGASNGSSNAATLNASLVGTSTNGKVYTWTFTARASSGTPTLRARTPFDHSDVTTGSYKDFVLSTSNQTFSITGKRIALENAYFGLLEAGTFFIDNIKATQIGCVSSYEIDTANPTQSLMLQDEAGATDLTFSASGVEQINGITQLNAVAARIGTSAATPADGELITKKLKVTSDGNGEIICERQSGGAGAIIQSQAAAVKLGATSNHKLQFMTNNTVRAAIDSSGNVSLRGSGTPANKLALGENDYLGWESGTNTVKAKIGFSSSGDKLILNNGGTDAMTISSAGLVTATSANQTTLTVVSSNAGFGGQSINASDGTNGKPIISWQRGGAEKAYDYVGTDNARYFNVNSADRLKIDSAGLATFTGEITCTGLTISNQTNTTTGTRSSSKLDHYEEGTWTVGLGGASSVGNTTGYYTRIGDTVHVSYYSGSLTSDGSAATISGLPFTVNANVYGGFFTYHNTYCPTASSGYFTVSTTVGYFTAENATATANTANASGRYIMFTGTYKV